MAARKKTGTGKKTAVRRRARTWARTDRQAALPASLKEFSQKVRRDLTLLERQIETASSDTVRHCTRVLRDVSHLLGRLAAAGEAVWRRSNQARLEGIHAVLELERALQPPKGKRPTRKTTRRRKPASRPGHRATSGPAP